MQYKNTQKHYGLISIIIHWLMAVLIIGLFVLGTIMSDLDYYDSNYHIFPWWHKSFGLLVVLLLLIRILWKLANPKVLPINSHKSFEIKLAKLMHTILYLLVFICCISGVMIATAEGAGIEFFTWFEVPALLANGENQAELAGKIHDYSTLALIITAALHMIAAIIHHFILKNDTLKRMLSLPKN